MKIEDFARAEFLVPPWPTLIDGNPVPSLLTESNRCLTRCPHAKKCSNDLIDGEHTCQHGMSYVVGRINGQRITVYGVRTDNNTTSLSPHNRAWYKGRRLELERIQQWMNRGPAFEGAFIQALANAQTGLLDVLHDPIRLAKQITTIANKLARASAPGLSSVRSIEEAPTDVKTLVKASEMLSESFGFLTIYMNPEAATYGRQTATNLHGLTTKIAAILRTNDEGSSRSGPDLRVSGSCLKNVAIYESFKLIPFALISNAIKYSPDKPILITINDVATGGVEISVASTGPLIEPDERDRIFQKNFRGRWASSFEGRGVGLYLADIVAKAHATRIEVASTDLRRKAGDVPLATNRFAVRVVS